MTREHIRRLVETNTNEADKNKREVLNILRHATKPIFPHEIEFVLRKKAEAEAHEEYEKGKILKSEMNALIKDKTMDIRTIHRKLAILVKEGLAERKKGEYSLTDKAKSDIRYFASEFGEMAFMLLMDRYFPHSYTTRQQSIQQLVKLLGTYILFCFIETARPVNNNRQQEKKNYSVREKERMTCLRNIISIQDMYDFFLAIVDYGLYYDNLSKHGLGLFYRDLFLARKFSGKETPVLPSAMDLRFVRRLRHNKVLEKALKEKQAYDSYLKGTSWDELDEDKLERLSDVLKDVYPIQYQQFHKVRSVYKNPKQVIADLRENWPSMIDREKSSITLKCPECGEHHTLSSPMLERLRGLGYDLSLRECLLKRLIE